MFVQEQAKVYLCSTKCVCASTREDPFRDHQVSAHVKRKVLERNMKCLCTYKTRQDRVT